MSASVRTGFAIGALIGLFTMSGAALGAEFGVAILQSLTGPAASVGVSLKDGALMFADEANQRHFLGEGNVLKTSVADDASDRTQAVTQMNRFAADPSFLIVMGPTSGSVALAGLAAANEAKIPATTLNNNPQEVFGTGPWSFMLTQPGSVTVPYLGRYAIETLKVKNCVAIGLIDNPASALIQRLFVDYISDHGGKFISQEGIKLADSDFAAIATKVASTKDIDCVFIATFAPQGANIVRQLREAGLDSKVRLMGYNALASPDLISKGGAAVEGFYLIADWMPSGVNEEGRAFIAAVKARTGNPPDFWGAVGYSQMKVIATAIKNAGPNPTREKVRDALAQSKDIPVVMGDGKFSLDKDRLPHYGMAVLMVKNGQFVEAPK